MGAGRRDGALACTFLDPIAPFDAFLSRARIDPRLAESASIRLDPWLRSGVGRPPKVSLETRGHLQVIWRTDVVARMTATAVGALWLILRAPHLLVAPRFWAEEAHYASAATRFGFWESMLYVYPRAGYYTWPANLGATLGIDLLPLGIAPIATTLVGGGLQLAPLLATLFVRFDFVPTAAQRAVAGIALITATTSGQGTTWLNTISSQIHLGTLTAVLLIGAARQATRTGSWALVAVLFLTGLSGAYSAFFIPVFLIAAIAGRDRWRARQTGALAIAAGFQACAFGYVSFILDRPNEKRVVRELGLDSAVTGARESIAMPLFGQPSVNGDLVNMDLLLAVAVAVVVLAVGVLISAVARNREYDDLGLLRWVATPEMRALWAWPVVVIPLLALSFDGIPAGRYAIVPGALTVAIVSLAAFRARARVVTWALSSVVLLSIAVGMSNPRYPEALVCDGSSSGFEEASHQQRYGKATWMPSCPDGWRIKVYTLGRAHDG